MTTNIPDECLPGAPMREQYVRPEHLRQMETIASVSSYDSGKSRWTDLGLYYRRGFNRPFVAVVEGVSNVPNEETRFKFMAAGTLDRALSWFEGSDLRDHLALAVPEDAAARYPSANDIQEARAVERAVRGAVERAVQDAIDHGVLTGMSTVAQALDDARYPVDWPEASAPALRVIGITTDRLGEVLTWLYPDLVSVSAMSSRMERDFGMPARTVRRAIAIEQGTAIPAGEQGAWVGMFLKAMRCFDRELWAAGQATIASVER